MRALYWLNLATKHAIHRWAYCEITYIRVRVQETQGPKHPWNVPYKDSTIGWRMVSQTRMSIYGIIETNKVRWESGVTPMPLINIYKLYFGLEPTMWTLWVQTFLALYPSVNPPWWLPQLSNFFGSVSCARQSWLIRLISLIIHLQFKQSASLVWT